MRDSSSSFRFPFISCEIFTCEIDVILKTLVEDEEVVFSFIISPFTQMTVPNFHFLCIWNMLHCYPRSHSWLNFILQLMDLLFSFLEPNRPHSALLAGYFSKVLYLTIHKFAYWQTSGNFFYTHISYGFNPFKAPRCAPYLSLFG